MTHKINEFQLLFCTSVAEFAVYSHLGQVAYKQACLCPFLVLGQVQLILRRASSRLVGSMHLTYRLPAPFL